MKGSFSFTKQERINQPQDFRRVMRKGKRRDSKNFVLFFEDNKISFHRLGIVVKKEIGQAPFRNQIRRYIREFFRLSKNQIKGSFDMVFLVKKGCTIRRFKEAEEELRGLFLL